MVEENPEQLLFSRQRRNLFIVGAALLAALHTDLSIDHVNFFGTHLTLGTSHSVAALLWWLWAYWFTRFVQAFLEIPDRGIKAAYSAKYVALVRSYGIKKVLSENRPSLAIDPSKYPQSKIAFEGDSMFPIAFTRVDVRYGVLRKDFKDGRQISGEQLQPEEVTLRGKELVVPKLLALIWVIFFTTKVTEYIFPFFVGVAPLIYWIIVRN